MCEYGERRAVCLEKTRLKGFLIPCDGAMFLVGLNDLAASLQGCGVCDGGEILRVGC